jgi:hypothetical protein
MDLYNFLAVFSYVIIGKYFINVINRYRSMDMILLQDNTLLIGHCCICLHVSSLHQRLIQTFSCQCSHPLERSNRDPTTYRIRRQQRSKTRKISVIYICISILIKRAITLENIPVIGNQSRSQLVKLCLPEEDKPVY